MLLNTIHPYFFKLNANCVKLGQEVMLACAFYSKMSVRLIACLGVVQRKAGGNRVYLSALWLCQSISTALDFFLCVMVFQCLCLSPLESHMCYIPFDWSSKRKTVKGPK